MTKFQDLTGIKFGMLTVLKQMEPQIKFYKNKKVIVKIWLCSCECGNKNKLIRGTEIKRQKFCRCLIYFFIKKCIIYIKQKKENLNDYK